MVEGDQSSATPLWKRFEHLHDADVDLNRIAEQERPRLTVPATSIYSRHATVSPDGRPASTRRDRSPRTSRSTRSHSSLGVHPAVIFAVLDRLRLPEGEWHPFRPPCPLRLWYPRPVSWRIVRGGPAQLVDV